MMDSLVAFHFVRPLWLLMLAPAFALFLLQHYRSDAADRWRSVIDPDLLKYLMVGGERRSRITPNGLSLAGWVLAVVAVAGPAWQYEPSPFADAKPPIMVLIKVTPSMTAKDLAPTRLDRARQKLSDLLATRQGAAAGLVAYSGSAHLVLPPTTDKDVMLTMAGALSPAIMPQEGDDIAEAIAMADSILSGGQRGGSIVVLADVVAGEEIAALAKRQPIHPVNFLGLIPPQQDTASLDDAARAVDGDVVPTTVDQADIVALGERIDRIERTTSVAGEGRYWREAGYWLVPILAVFVLGWFRRGWVMT